MPAAIVARCPECAKGLKLKPSAAGKTVKCPACGAAVPVPAAEGADEAVDETGGASQPARAKTAKAKRRRSAAPAADPTGSGNSGELFASLDLAKYGHDSGRQKALPGRAYKGPSTSEMPVFEGKGDAPPTPLPMVLGIVGGSLLLVALAAGGAFFLLMDSGETVDSPAAAAPAAEEPEADAE